MQSQLGRKLLSMCDPEIAEDVEPDYEFEPNTYEKFMRKHLQHYGYYTGRNQGYRHKFRRYTEWEKTDDFTLASESSESESDDDDDDKQDNKLQEEILRTTQLIYSYEAGRMVPRLREPRNLYALAKELGPQQAARWPTDSQVLRSRIKHIRYVPPNPEKFYQPTGQENTPMVRGEEYGGRLVYEYENKGSFFVRACVGGAKNGYSTCCVPLMSDQDQTLLFESRFECGNLAKVVQVGEFDYELWLKYDYYTQKHTQWFYFQVSNTRANQQYRFTIVNFMKPDSLYNNGMKPLMYSEKEAQQRKVGWQRSGSSIRYYRNNKVYSTSKGDKPFYSLTWTVQFSHDKDLVYFAHCFPYTYTDLQDYLLEVSNDPIKSKICKQRVLCRTLAGNLVYILTITSPSQNPQDIKYKRAVVLTARVHPGESNSSWMMKGFLDYLTGNSADAKLLRDTFVFKIVPMLNPDGVIVGNYRCSLSGRDLNRNYKTVLKDSFPPVWHTRNMIRRLSEEREIVVYCDLHGHSRKQNVFIYGCENRYSANRRLRERIFPMMLHKNAPDKFSFDSCKFKIQKSKEGTGRIVMWNMGIMNSYTMEATFCGSTLGKKKGQHFSVVDFEMMGYHFCDTLLDYCDPDNTKAANIYLDLEERLKKEILVRLENQGMSTEEIDLSDDYVFGLESTDGGSDSSGSDGLPIHLQYLSAQANKKKKKLRSRKERDRQRLLKEAGKKTSTSSVQDAKSHEKRNSGQSLTINKQDKSTGQRYPDDRNNNGMPIFIQERCENRQTRRNEYLEALTRTYLQSGVLVGSETATPHFRYSGNKLPAIPFSMEGLCAHHEQALAAKYMTHQLRSLQPTVPGMLALVGRPVRREPRSASSLPARLRRVRSDIATSILRKLNLTQPGVSVDNTIQDFIHDNLPSERVVLHGIPSQRHLLEIVVAREREQFMESLKRKGDGSKSTGDLIQPSADQGQGSPNTDAGLQKTYFPKGRASSVTPINSESSNSMTGPAGAPGMPVSADSMDVPERDTSSKLSGDKTPDSDARTPSPNKPRKTSGGKKKKKLSADLTMKTDRPVSPKKKSVAKTAKLDIPLNCSPDPADSDHTQYLTPPRDLHIAESEAAKVERYSPRNRGGRESVVRRDVHVTHPTDLIVVQAKSCKAQPQGSGQRAHPQGVTNRCKSSNDSPREQRERASPVRKNVLSRSQGQLQKHGDTFTEAEKSQPKAQSLSPSPKSKLTSSASHFINRLMQEADEEIRELTTELEEDVKRERKLVQNLQGHRPDVTESVPANIDKDDSHDLDDSGDGSVSPGVVQREECDSPLELAGEHAHEAQIKHEPSVEVPWNTIRIGSATSTCTSCEETPSRKESFSRLKSSKHNKRELIGAAPAKISLMIPQDSHEQAENLAAASRHFLPLSRHHPRPVHLRHSSKKS